MRGEKGIALQIVAYWILAIAGVLLFGYISYQVAVNGGSAMDYIKNLIRFGR